jgi:ABC-type amino acid transport substrate-binding protein
MKYYLLAVLAMLSFAIQSKETLKIGIKVSPPFVNKYHDGSYGGVAIDLIDKVARDIGVEYELMEESGDFNSLIKKASRGDSGFDIFVSSSTITSDRLNFTNFTQPFHGTSSAVVMTATESSMMDAIFTWKFVKSVMILFLIVLILGVTFWVIERNRNPLFEKGPWGILDGSYFVTAVMGTFGFGDIVTKTKAGKLICIFLMWLSLGITGVFIANVASALTVAALEDDDFNLNDLTKLKVGTIGGTSSSEFLYENDIKFVVYNTPIEALDAMNEDELDAFVYDKPVIKYYLGEDKYEGLRIVGKDFVKQNYGIASGNQELINRLNPAIIRAINSDNWDETLSKYNLD